MKNLLIASILSGTFLLSCNIDDNLGYEDENIVIANLESTLFEHSNIGVYKGVFTTLDNSERGTLEISIPSSTQKIASFIDDARPKAVLQLSSGKRLLAYAKNTIKENQNIENLVFTSPDFEFSFSVGANGQFPMITNVLLGQKESSVLIAKHTSRAPIFPIPGTYVCTDCGTHPTLNNTTQQTFNILSNDPDFPDPDPNPDPNPDPDPEPDPDPCTSCPPPPPPPAGLSVSFVQVSLGNTIFNGIGDINSISSPPNEDGIVTVSMEGFVEVGQTEVVWSGIHTFYNGEAGDNDCSEVSGTWTWPSDNFGTLTGTYESDIVCPE